MVPDAIVQKIEALPVQPGVYLFKDTKGVVVYVGKATSLRSRVRSYFQDSTGDGRAFVPLLQRTVGDLDTIVTGNEKEATILENNLIKEYRPRYNVKLRDDKDFITLRLGLTTAIAPPVDASSSSPPRASPRSLARAVAPAEALAPRSHAYSERAGRPVASQWPRLEVVRRPTPDGARYFGPYHSATAARRTLHLVNKHFQLRTCSDIEFASRKRPCLQHQIKRCPAPCVLPVDASWYEEQAGAVAKFLEGRHDELSRDLQARMKGAAQAMRFELAAVYRDQLRAIDKVREEQRVVTIDDVDRDVVGFYREGDLVEIALLHVLAGKLADVATYAIKQAEIPDEEIVAAFLAQHYGASLAPLGKSGDDAADAAPVLVPDEVILPCEPEGLEGIAEWLADRARHKVALLVPKRGHRVDLLALANDNARHSFVEKQRQSDDVEDRLRDLQERLRLSVLPRRIECCDISHLGGGDTVGAIVAMTNGELDKKRYRTFTLRGEAHGADRRLAAAARDELEEIETATRSRDRNDDYASMYEVLARRFRRAVSAREASAAAEAEEALDDRDVESAESGDVEVGEHGEPGEDEALRGEEQGEDTAEDEARDTDEDSSEKAAEKARKEGERVADWEAPDLFVVDGGRGQLAVALAAAHDIGLHDLAIVGLAKERENVMGETLVDRVYLPGQKNPIPLKSTTTSLFWLARLRDEAHRFSNRARMRIGKKKRMRSPLDDVKGLGEKAKKALLTAVGNLAALRAADDATLLAVPGVTGRHVKALRAAFPATVRQAPTSVAPAPAAASSAGAPLSQPPTNEGDRQRS